MLYQIRHIPAPDELVDQVLRQRGDMLRSKLDLEPVALDTDGVDNEGGKR